MPRKLRLEFPGAIYHVMSRGDQREDIFLCDVDRYDFLLSIKQIAESLHLGKPKGAKANVHKSLNPAPRLTSELQLGL